MELYQGKDKYLNFSIDNLTIVGELNFPEFFNMFLNAAGVRDASNVINDCRNIFQYSFKNDDLGYIQVDKDTLKVRIEFNPNKLGLQGKATLNTLLIFLKKDSIHFTRIDLAIDLFNYKISEYNIVDIGTRKKAYFYSKTNKLETFYSGSNKSSKYIRIYNKAVEQKLPNLDWWRFEIQLRDVYIDKYLNELVRFYDDILIYKYSSIERYSIETNAMIEYLLHDITRLNSLSKNQKTKYKKIIKDLEVKSIDFLDDVVGLATSKVRSYLDYICSSRRLGDWK